MKILTCNVRCCGANDGENGWDRRKDFCADVIRAQSADLVGFQELWTEQFEYLAPRLDGYRSFAMADEPAGRRPVNAIFYRADRLARISAGGYWLSERPHVPGSRSWQSACVRLANWVRFEDRLTGREFRFVNTHLDHVSQAARERQAGLIVEDASAYPDSYPQLLAGDMNCDARNPAIAAFKAGGWRDTYGEANGTEDPGFTFHRFLGPRFAGRADGAAPDEDARTGKMDWIFLRGRLEAMEAEVIQESRDGRFPSDHYFVSAAVRFA